MLKYTYDEFETVKQQSFQKTELRLTLGADTFVLEAPVGKHMGEYQWIMGETLPGPLRLEQILVLG